MTDTGEKSLRYIPFDGKKENWAMWSEKFLIRSISRGYHGILTGEVTVPKSDTGTETEGQESESKAKETADIIKKANTLGYGDLITAMENTTAFNLVRGSKTAELPQGDLAKAWKVLTNRYEPKTKAAMSETKLEFAQSKLKQGQEPEEWIAALEALQFRLHELGSTLSDEDMLIHILNNLTKEYDTIVELHQDKIGLESGGLTLEVLREVLAAKFKRINKPADAEQALAISTGKKFKGKCRVCGKIGHKAADCWEREGNKKPDSDNSSQTQGSKKPRFKGKCGYCKKPGHKEADCWKKKADLADKAKPESANTTTDNDSEQVLMTMERPSHATTQVKKMLGMQLCTCCPNTQDENASRGNSFETILIAAPREAKVDETTWVADTGATSHMTYSAAGMFNLQQVEKTYASGTTQL